MAVALRGGGALAVDVCAYACLWYLAGGSYSDVRFYWCLDYSIVLNNLACVSRVYFQVSSNNRRQGNWNSCWAYPADNKFTVLQMQLDLGSWRILFADCDSFQDQSLEHDIIFFWALPNLWAQYSCSLQPPLLVYISWNRWSWRDGW